MSLMNTWAKGNTYSRGSFVSWLLYKQEETMKFLRLQELDKGSIFMAAPAGKSGVN